jgi:SsrA-binding protein
VAKKTGNAAAISDGNRLAAQNRRARYDYAILETYEAGIVLQGSEVKSLRDGSSQIADSYATVESGEVWLHGLHIPPYKNASGFGEHMPDRKRKLLLSHREIAELVKATTAKGLTLVPLDVHFSNGRAKVTLAVARGKSSVDRRHSIAERDANRDAQRELASRNRGER